MTTLSAWLEQEEKSFLDLVHQKIPAKVLELNVHIAAWVAPTTEEEMCIMIDDLLLPIDYQLMLHLQQSMRFLQTRTPKIEDGNNSGVDVLKSVRGSLVSLANICTQAMRNMSDMCWVLGQRQAKAIKYPGATAFKRSYTTGLQEDCSYLFVYLVEFRDVYVEMQDLITKNEPVLLVPRKNQENSMYE